MTTNRPIFIVGVGRSGTTLLRLMLNAHPNIAIPYESHFMTQYQNYQHGSQTELSDDEIHTLLSEILNEPMLQQWGHRFSVEKLKTRMKKRTLGGAFDAIYSDYAESNGKSRWGDKSDYLDRMHLINQLFPNCLFIHIVRDGRDVAASVMARTWGPRDLVAAAEWWSHHVILGRRMGSMLSQSRYIEVKFEDLVGNAEQELQRLCSFIGEEYDAEMLAYHTKSRELIPESMRSQHYNTDSKPDSTRASAWKQEMKSVDVDLFSNYGAQGLLEFNYLIPQRKTSTTLIFLKKLLIFGRRMFRPAHG